ncbi:MAG: cupin [Proteobacteria bacterium]|nr:cupin [Pseudomonadota bacterium]
MSKRGVATKLIDNDRVRVLQWRLEPEAATGFHRHEFDYVIVPIRDGTLLIKESAEERRVELTAGQPYFREQGVEHDVVNGGGTEVIFVEVEIK